MKTKIRNSILMIVLCLSLTACCSFEEPKDFFVNKQPLPSGYEYTADVVVTKKGFWFLWCIPFRRACEEKALELMVQEVRKELPYSDGICEIKILEDYGVSLFNWVTGITMSGRIVTKQK